MKSDSTERLRRKVPVFLFAGLASFVLLLAGAGTPEVHAQPVCLDLPTNGTLQLCISLDPATATNDVGASHTVTATVTADGAPSPDEAVAIVVVDGPNVDKGDIGVTDANGRFAITYTGDAGPGADTIVGCITDPESTELCINFGTPEQPAEVADQATKQWVQPTPSPTATVAATPTPTAAASPTVAAAVLPGTGGSSEDGNLGGFWFAVALGAFAPASVAGLLFFAFRRGRLR